MIVSLFADRRTVGVAEVAHDLAVRLRTHLSAPSLALYVDPAVLRTLAGQAVDIQPQALPASLPAELRPSDHAVLAMVGAITEPVITAFDLSSRILVVTDGAVPALRAAQRAFKLCRDLAYPRHRVVAVVLTDDAPRATDVDAVRVALRGEPFVEVPRAATSAARGAACARLLSRVLRGAA